MLRRLAGWWERQREAGALHGIISGLVVAAIGLLLLAPWNRTPQKKTLSKKVQARLAQRAEDLAPGVIQFAQELRPCTRELEDDPNEHLDRYIAWVVEWSEAFSAAVEAEVAGVAAQEGVSAAEVRKFLHVRLQESTGRCVPALSSAGAIGVRSLFSAPRIRMSPPSTVQEAIEETIQKLLALLPTLQPQGQAGLKKAILKLRSAIVPFDTKPIEVVFTAPAAGIVVNSIPEISFVMSDTGSGPDPGSRKLQVLNNGPVVIETTDLTGYAAVVSNDQVTGVVKVNAIGIPDSALQDGFLTLHASGTDYAGNATSVATRDFVLDRMGPGIAIVAPANGSITTDPAAPLSAAISDSVSGVAPGSVQVMLNGVDVTSLIVSTPGNLNPLGAPESVTLTGVLPAAAGPNTLVLFAKDIAGNESVATSSFEFLPVVTEEDIQLAIDGGDGQAGTSGRCVAAPLVVRATTMGGIPIEGLSIQFRVSQGSGELVSPSGLTDSSGRASVRYQLGRVPGPEKVKAFAANLPDGSSVEFALESQSAILQLSNFMPTEVSEFPGSALPLTFLVEGKRFDGSALSGEEVVPELLDFNGAPFPDPGAIGQFHPRIGKTGVDGSVRFAFEIAPGAFQALAGETGGGTGALQFQVRFRLNDFVDSQGNPVSTVVQSATVQNPENKPLGIFDGKGQGQIVLPGKTTPQKLEAFTNEMGFGGAANSLTFTIVEGGGSLLDGGGVGDGTFTPAVVDPDGNVVQAFVQPVAGSNVARVRYKKGTTSSPSLVALSGSGGIFFDVFVVSVPQAFWVDSTGALVHRLHAARSVGFESTDQYRLRVLTQADLPQAPTATVKSQNGCLADVESGAPEVAESVLELPSLATLTSTAPDRFAMYESPQIVITSDLFPPDGGMPTSATKLVHCLGGNAMRFMVHLEQLDLTSAPTWVAGGMVTADSTTDVVISSKIVAVLKGVPQKGGRTLQFFVDDVGVGTAVTDAAGTATMEFSFASETSVVRVRDDETDAMTFAFAVARVEEPGHAHFNPGDGEYVPPAVLEDETEEKVKAVLKESASGKTLLEDADVKDKFTVEFVSSTDTGEAGEARFDKTTGKYKIKIVKSGDLVRAAITLKHELFHVKKKVEKAKEFEKLIAATEAYKEEGNELASSRKIFEYAAFRHAYKKMIQPAIPNGKAFAVNVYLELEFEAYEAGLKTKEELAAKGKTTTWYKELVGKTEAQRKDTVKATVKAGAEQWWTKNQGPWVKMDANFKGNDKFNGHLDKVIEKHGDKLLRYFTDQDIFPTAK